MQSAPFKFSQVTYVCVCVCERERERERESVAVAPFLPNCNTDSSNQSGAYLKQKCTSSNSATCVLCDCKHYLTALIHFFYTLYICTQMHTHPHIHTNAHTHSYTPMHSHTHTNMHTHTHAHAHMHTPGDASPKACPVANCHASRAPNAGVFCV